MRRKTNSYIVYCLLLLSILFASALQTHAQEDSLVSQTETRNITAAEWNEITNDQEFHYRDSIEYKPIVVKKRDLTFFEKFLMWLGGPVGQFIAWGLLVLIIIYAVYKIIVGERGGIFGRKSKKDPSLIPATTEEDINETKWEELLQNAARDGDLRLSVRYGYMWLLQVLQQSRLIEYRNDKTNYEYYSELSDSPYKAPFRQLSRQYEYTWYGGFPISRESYDEYVKMVYQLQKQLERR